MGEGQIDCTALCSGALGGELLPDWDDPWVEGERERLRQLRLHMLEAVADRFTATGQFGLAIEVAFRVLQADALRESAHRALIRAHVAEGNIVEARRAYSVCEQLLHRELASSISRRFSERQSVSNCSKSSSGVDANRTPRPTHSPSRPPIPPRLVLPRWHRAPGLSASEKI
jgi:DNA-binding SARP family transcriptional activator